MTDPLSNLMGMFNSPEPDTEDELLELLLKLDVWGMARVHICACMDFGVSIHPYPAKREYEALQYKIIDYIAEQATFYNEEPIYPMRVSFPPEERVGLTHCPKNEMKENISSLGMPLRAPLCNDQLLMKAQD